MVFRFTVASLFILQVAQTQYYATPSFFPPYNYNYYYYNSNNYYNPPSVPVLPTITPTYQTPKLSTSPPKRSVTTSIPKCSPPTATAYFLPAPAEKVKATVIPPDKVNIPPPKFTCPLCNGFADILPNPKIAPPPPVGSPVLPGILDKIPTIDILEDLKIITDSKSKQPIPDMYEKHKLPKNLRFDQELLEGFLTGLGLAL